MRRFLSVLFLVLLLPFMAQAQSVPNGTITPGLVWNTAQWNAAWQAKVDVAGGTCIGCTLGGTFTGNGAGITNLNGSNITSGTVGASYLPTFGAAAAGIVPLSGGGTTNFLRADGSWATPGGAGSGTVTSVTAATPSSTLTIGGTNPVTTSGTISFDLNLSHANTWAAAQTFPASGILLTGSSTGLTTIASANAGASNYTLTLPAVTGTLLTTAGNGSSLSGLQWSQIGSTPTTLAGYGITSPLPVNQGGTNASSASGTALDNITGFSSNGIVNRTGAGAYSFLTAPAGTIVGTTDNQTLTNKSIAASEINSGQIAVAQGGTNLSSGTSGGILGFTASGTIASSTALASNGIVLGGGAGATPATASGLVTDGTSKITLGVAGASVGAVALNNATSGSITVQPVTGALGSSVLSLPATTGTLLTSGTSTQTFTSSGTFTAVTGAKFYQILLWGQGGAGGGGIGIAAAASGSGGGGGGGGAFVNTGIFPASLVSGNATITIGTQNTTTAAGASGAVGGNASVTWSGLGGFTAYGGGGGAVGLSAGASGGGGGGGLTAVGGSTSNGTGGTAGTNGGTAGGSGVAAAANLGLSGGAGGGGTGATGVATGTGAVAGGSAGGGSGGGTNAGTAQAGGNGNTPLGSAAKSGGAATGAAGATGYPAVGNAGGGGGSGGGGNSGTSTAGGNGGAGGAPGGGGGGGGTSAGTSATGGTGGAGGTAQVIVIAYF